MDYTTQIITWSISLGALALSITTIIITRKNVKKQLRLSKLEEIAEILFYFKSYYHLIYDTFIGYKQSSNIDFKDTSYLRKALIEAVTKEIVIEKVFRLKVLSNSYLPNTKKRSDLKVRIQSLGTILYRMYIFVYLEGNNETIKKIEGVEIAEPEKLYKFINQIQKEIIAEMRLGYQSTDEENESKYLLNQFKKDLNH